MNLSRPTIEAAGDSTIRAVDGRAAMAGQGGDLELAEQMRRDDLLVTDRSYVVEQAVEEYAKLAASNPQLSPRDYCHRFVEFGPSLQGSIFRQLEVEQLMRQNEWLKKGVQEVPWPRPGDYLGSAIVREELGRGALARAYLCVQPDVGQRQVVIKVGGPALVEANLLGRLRHVAIVPILSAENDHNGHGVMLCMPFLGRSTLLDVIDLKSERRQELSAELILAAARRFEKPTDAAGHPDGSATWRLGGSTSACISRLGARLAAALEHAHALGILHGDIKPSNVLLSRQGAPLLMDFNLSGSSALALTARGGTLPYMPPEQLRTIVEPGSVDSPYDRRSDLFSLGVVLYELYCGRLPFPLSGELGEPKGLAAELLRRQAAGCVPLRQHDRAIPPSLARLIERCLNFHPDDRPESATLLRDALDRESRWTRQARHWVFARRFRMVAIACAAISVPGALAALFLTTPPRHVRLINRAIALQDSGDLKAAERMAEEARVLEPSYRPARLELGKLALARKDYGHAMEQFSYLASTQRDARGMAYLGYCFAQRGESTNALPWFKRASEYGLSSGANYNNYAVALEGGESEHSLKQRALLAEAALEEALRLLPTSRAVRYNWIRHELYRAELDGSSISPRGIQFCRELTAEYPDLGNVQVQGARLWTLAFGETSAELLPGISMLSQAAKLGWAPHPRELQRDAFWSPCRQLPQFAEVIEQLQAPEPARRGDYLRVFMPPDDGHVTTPVGPSLEM
jgi:tetratricopeptide (TPR) repeat protein